MRYNDDLSPLESKWFCSEHHTRFSRHLTDLRFCCAANVVTASEAREPDAYRDCSNRLLGGGPNGSVKCERSNAVKKANAAKASSRQV